MKTMQDHVTVCGIRFAKGGVEADYMRGEYSLSHLYNRIRIQWLFSHRPKLPARNHLHYNFTYFTSIFFFIVS